MDCGELQLVKTIIKSIVLSSRKKLTMLDLQRDYKNMEGTEIPYGKLGYQTLYALLMSMQDAVLVNGYGSTATLEAVVNTKTQHLSELVKGQKTAISKNDNKKDMKRLYASIHDDRKYASSNLMINGREMHAKETDLNHLHDCNITTFAPTIDLILDPTHRTQNFTISKCGVLNSADKLNGHSNNLTSIKRGKCLNESDEFNSLSLNSASSEQSIDSFNSAASKFDFKTEDQQNELKLSDELLEFGEAAPRKELPHNLKLNDMIVVSVTEVYNLNKMWISLQEDAKLLKVLKQQIDEYFQSVSFNESWLPIEQICPGRMCAVKFDKCWHRAEIQTTVSNHRAGVYFVDYGTFHYAHVGDMRFLPQKFTVTPRLATRAYLSHIRPISKYWSRKVTNYFWHLCGGKSLLACITEINREERTLGLVLLDAGACEEININQLLVDEKLALYNIKCRSQSPHQPSELNAAALLPTFDMLECGKHTDWEMSIELEECSM